MLQNDIRWYGFSHEEPFTYEPCLTLMAMIGSEISQRSTRREIKIERDLRKVCFQFHAYRDDPDKKNDTPCPDSSGRDY